MVKRRLCFDAKIEQIIEKRPIFCNLFIKHLYAFNIFGDYYAIELMWRSTVFRLDKISYQSMLIFNLKTSVFYPTIDTFKLFC